MIKFILSTILVIFPILNNASDIDKGYQAYKKQNYINAYKHWIVPANNGDRVSQYNIALLYFFGNGVEQNLETAFKYCRKAAVQGLPRAQNNLAHMYANGLGIQQNYVLSYQWSFLAYKNGYPSKKLLDESRSKLNDIQLNKYI